MKPPNRRTLLYSLCLAAVLPAALAAGLAGYSAQADTGSSGSSWAQWDGFAGRFLQADGRIVDLTFDAKSTSEGQSYGLFFALVANRRAQFDQILAWTSANLADGQLGAQLPAWLWGRREDGSWGIKDKNSASDADLWIAYALFEAARLWQAPHYAETARQLLGQIRQREIIQAGPVGLLLLLPAPVGFILDQQRYRIDPSYLPGFMFSYFAQIDPGGPWQAVWDAYLRLAPRIFAAGVAPDLVLIDAHGEVFGDTEKAPSGSYDAIRVYLWAGMSMAGSELLLRLLTPYAKLVGKLGAPPENINPQSGAAVPASYSPIGYSGALLPFLKTIGDNAALAAQLRRLTAAGAAARAGQPTNYYDQVLILFGQGWLDGRYRFDAQGRLLPQWSR
jgi:endoglucanase